MKFLIDTNIFIKLEPLDLANFEQGSSLAIKLAKLVQSSGNQLFLHPDQRIDIGRDSNVSRRYLRQYSFDKYPCLESPACLSPSIEQILGSPKHKTNDWVDARLLASLHSNAVDFLVTEDQRLHKKSTRLDLQDRVLTVADALAIIERLLYRIPTPPPAVDSIPAYLLDESDPIFDTLRKDYQKFDNWLATCKLEQRQAWRICLDNDRLAAFCIVKTEQPGEYDLNVKTLKICSFKVASDCSGYRFGELLLKAIFSYANSNEFEYIYITVFDKYSNLINLMEDFGFQDIGKRTRLGEIVLAKPLRFSEEDANNLDPLSFNIRYGPYAIKTEKVPFFIVPIKPQYHKLLFPEAEQQIELLPGAYPFGNSIRKAYLSNAKIRSLVPGANLLFYRSTDYHGITCLGVVEGTIVSSSAVEIARYVGKRTVYRFETIERFCSSPVLAILFRLSRILTEPVTLKELQAAGIISTAPQSIMRPPGGLETWIAARLGV